MLKFGEVGQRAYSHIPRKRQKQNPGLPKLSEPGQPELQRPFSYTFENVRLYFIAVIPNLAASIFTTLVTLRLAGIYRDYFIL